MEFICTIHICRCRKLLSIFALKITTTIDFQIRFLRGARKYPNASAHQIWPFTLRLFRLCFEFYYLSAHFCEELRENTRNFYFRAEDLSCEAQISHTRIRIFSSTVTKQNLKISFYRDFQSKKLQKFSPQMCIVQNSILTRFYDNSETSGQLWKLFKLCRSLK